MDMVAKAHVIRLFSTLDPHTHTGPIRSPSTHAQRQHDASRRLLLPLFQHSPLQLSSRARDGIASGSLSPMRRRDSEILHLIREVQLTYANHLFFL